MSNGDDLAQNHKGGANRKSSPPLVEQTYNAITELNSSQLLICVNDPNFRDLSDVALLAIPNGPHAVLHDPLCILVIFRGRPHDLDPALSPTNPHLSVGFLY